MDIELLKQELLRRLAPPSVKTPIGTIPSAVMAPLHYGALGPIAPETNLATNTPQGLDTMRAILAIAMAGQAGQQGLQQLQGGMLQNRYNAGVEGAYSRLPEGLFNPAQSGAIKSRLGDYVAGRMPELNPNLTSMYSGAGVPAKVGQTIPFNLRTPQLLSLLSQEVATPNQILGFLSGKVRKSELEGLGIPQFLEGKSKVTKQELLKHIEQSTPQIEEVVKGGKPVDIGSLKKAFQETSKDYWVLGTEINQYVIEKKGSQFVALRLKPPAEATTYADAVQIIGKYLSFQDAQNSVISEVLSQKPTGITSAKFSQYQLPGGSNYKEVVVKAPTEGMVGPRIIKYDSIDRMFRAYDKNGNMVGEAKTQDELQGDVSVKAGNFKSSHWDEPNPLLHLRKNDRLTDKKEDVSFLEELQSDWAKTARSGGQYKVEPATNLPGNQWWVTDTINESDVGRAFDTKQEAQDWVNQHQSPSHPLLKNWQELGIKKWLMDSVNEGKKYISWTTGEQQADRYDLATVLNEVKWNKSEWHGRETKAIDLIEKEGHNINLEIEKDGTIIETWGGHADWRGRKINEVIGKGIAEKIIENPKGKLSGKGLSFGGEWAKNLYDKQIPNILRDLTGGKITEILMPTGTKKDGSPVYLKQPALELTPEIKDDIKKKGFDLFSALPKYEAESFANIKKQKEPKSIHYRV